MRGAKSKGRKGGPISGSEGEDVNEACSAPYEYDRACDCAIDDEESVVKEKFWREDKELSDVVDEDAAEFVNGIVRGLEYDESPGPSGLGDGEGRECATADGEGGSRSVMPRRCSTVKEGIYTIY